MTAIVGCVIKKQTWIGADSCASTDWRRFPVSESKIVEIGTGDGRVVTLGYTSSFRFGQILKHHVVPAHDIRSDASEFMVRDFIPAMRSALSEHGWLHKNNERETGGTALATYKGRLFAIQDDLSVLESRTGLMAVGSGEDFALGAMTHALSIGRSAEVVVNAGLEAAASLAPGVMPPFDVRRTA